MRRVTRRGLTVTSAMVATVGAAGAAWAWQILGNAATGSAKAASIEELVVSAGPNPVTGLYPKSAVDLVVTVENKNSFAVKINSVSVDRGGISADSAHAGNGCTWSPGPHAAVTTTNINYSPPANNRTVQPGGTLVLTFAGAIKMAIDAPTACAGATFSIPVEVGAETP